MPCPSRAPGVSWRHTRPSFALPVPQPRPQREGSGLQEVRGHHVLQGGGAARRDTAKLETSRQRQGSVVATHRVKAAELEVSTLVTAHRENAAEL